MLGQGWKRVLPTVGFPVVQFNPIQQSWLVVGIVPRAVVANDFILVTLFQLRDSLLTFGIPAAGLMALF